ncbi:MAG: hypothetical protein ACJAX5_000253 [Patiriisocius sp.]
MLDAKVQTAYLHEAHSEVATNHRLLEARVVARRSDNSQTEDTSAERSKAFMGKLKDMSRSDTKSADEESRKRISVTEEEAEALEPFNVYLDNGIYSASLELAALAGVFHLPDQGKDTI